MGRKALMAALACLAMLAFGGAARAATLEISPAGAITGTSNGPITFRTETVTVSCQFDFAGSLVETAIGFGTGAIVPEVDPNIGTITEASLSGCEGGATVELLTEELPWVFVRTNSFSGNSLSMYPARLHFTNTLLGINCTYTEGISFFGTSTTEMTVWVPPLQEDGATGECDTGKLEPSGSVTLSPEQTIVRRR
jgi:hypothetical protein